MDLTMIIIFTVQKVSLFVAFLVLASLGVQSEYKKTRTRITPNTDTIHVVFIIKELAKEFKKQFTCLGENTE